MHEVLNYIREYGDWFYLITFVWTALEGETFVIFAALLAQRGYLNIAALFSAAWIGSFCGDQLFFFFGRYFGKRLFKFFPSLKPKTDKVLSGLEKYHVIFILSYRFMYGVRNISGIAVGLSRLPWRRFATLNFLAAFIWATAFCGAGYLFGNLSQHISRHAEESVTYSVREIMLTVLGLFALIVVVRMLVLRFLLSNGRPVKTKRR